MKPSKKELRRKLEVAEKEQGLAEEARKEAEALIAHQRRLLGEADKKLLAVEEKVQELEKTIQDKTNCMGCPHNNDLTNKPLSRQYCQSCSRRAKDKYVILANTCEGPDAWPSVNEDEKDAEV